MYIIDKNSDNIEQINNCLKNYLQNKKVEHIVIAVQNLQEVTNLCTEGMGVSLVVFNERSKEMNQELIEDFTNKGFEIIIAQTIVNHHDEHESKKYGSSFSTAIMENTIDKAEAGVRNCVWAASIALEANKDLLTGPILAVSYSEKILDTLILIKPSFLKRVVDSEVLEVICKPY